MATNPFAAGDVIHGFCGGAFGRDSYACRRVEAVGPDWVVTRNANNGVELVHGEGDDLAWVARQAGDRSYCSDQCGLDLRVVYVPKAQP